MVICIPFSNILGSFIIGWYQDNVNSILLRVIAFLCGIFVAEILMLATCPFSLKWKRNLSRFQFLICILYSVGLFICLLYISRLNIFVDVGENSKDWNITAGTKYHLDVKSPNWSRSCYYCAADWKKTPKYCWKHGKVCIFIVLLF